MVCSVSIGTMLVKVGVCRLLVVGFLAAGIIRPPTALRTPSW